MAINENIFKKIDGRDWVDIKSQWFSYLPNIDPPGSPPEIEINQNQLLSGIYNQAKESPTGTYYQEVQNLREDIFREGIFLIHKANNTCCATNNQLNNGFLSWPISTAYQSSFFALKGILCLLGISIPQVGMHHLIIDAFPKDEPLSKKQIKSGYKPEARISFTYPKGQLNHRDHWLLFQRLLRVSNISIWDSEHVKFLKDMETDRFRDTRNSLHYKSNYWTWETDLFNRVYDDNLGSDQEYLNRLKASSSEDDTYYINFILIKFAIDLISDLAGLANNVKSELDLMKAFYNLQDNSRIQSSVNLFR